MAKEGVTFGAVMNSIFAVVNKKGEKAAGPGTDKQNNTQRPGHCSNFVADTGLDLSVAVVARHIHGDPAHGDRFMCDNGSSSRVLE